MDAQSSHQAESQTNTAPTDNDSTIDEVLALAPLGQEWFRSVCRQYNAGKSLFSAEWALVKRCLVLIAGLALVLTALLVGVLALINVLLGHLMLIAGLSLTLSLIVLLVLNGLGLWLCVGTLIGVAKQANFSRSVELFFSQPQQTEATEANKKESGDE